MPYRAKRARRSLAPTWAFAIRRTDATQSRPTPLQSLPTGQPVNWSTCLPHCRVTGDGHRGIGHTGDGISANGYRHREPADEIRMNRPCGLERTRRSRAPTYYFQFSAIQGVGKTRRYHFPLRPTNASGGLGTPWNTTIFAPSGIVGVWKNENGKYFTQ